MLEARANRAAIAPSGGHATSSRSSSFCSENIVVDAESFPVLLAPIEEATRDREKMVAFSTVVTLDAK
ncbi:hypothetical protein ACVWXN_006920 [Bradyrhizobium sp. i1.4.4]